MALDGSAARDQNHLVSACWSGYPFLSIFYYINFTIFITIGYVLRLYFTKISYISFHSLRYYVYIFFGVQRNWTLFGNW